MLAFEIRFPDGSSRELGKEWIRLGRAKENDIVIANPTISRFHLNIYPKNDHVVIEDAGSHIGFYVNKKAGSRAEKCVSGDIITVGNFSFALARVGQPLKSKPPKPKVSGIQVEPLLNQKSIKPPATQSSSGRILLYGGVLLVGALLFMSEDTPESEPTSEADYSFKSLPADGFQLKTPRLRSESEVKAEGKFREGMRDYFNKNYGRALLAFQEAKSYNPQHQGAHDYTIRSRQKMEVEIKDLLSDARKSFAVSQYKRAKYASMQILTILIEQIPGYTRKISQEANEEGKKLSLNQGQEETLKDIPCSETFDVDVCKSAISIMNDSRKFLGDEDILKRYER